MSVESAKAFLKKFASDEDFRKSIENAASDEERQKIVKEAGFEFTKADLKELAASSGELSEEDLEKVAGGSTVGWVTAAAGVGGAAAGTAGAVAAAF